MVASDGNPSQAKLDPAALSVADAARVLSAAIGQRIAAEMIEADIAAGAPLNEDGSINLVRYTAWLVRRSARRAN